MLGLCLTFAALTHQSLEISMLLVVVQFYFSVEVATGLMSLSSPEMERPIMMSQGFPLSEIYMYKEGGGGAQFQTKNPPTLQQHPSNSDLLSIITPLFLRANQ